MSLQDDCSSPPHSPEIGMAKEDGGDVSDAELSLEEEHDVDLGPIESLVSMLLPLPRDTFAECSSASLLGSLTITLQPPASTRVKIIVPNSLERTRPSTHFQKALKK
jgi:hypothetical protein